jgi:surface carbohydrate biosynthesis protein (TIGR04326 family)
LHLIIIDNSNPVLSEHFDQLILWQSYREAAFPDAVSIPVLVEKNANNLRSRYLKLIYDLGEVRVRKTKLYDSLELRPGLSYWWTTLVAEKCNFAKSPFIADVVRLFAFDQWAADFHGIKSMKLISANPELHECLKKWCKAKGIRFECHQLANKTKAIPALKQVFNRLPHTIKAVFWLLKYLIDRWPLRGTGIEDWKKVTTAITFISYLFNLQPKAARVGRFESNYWTELPNVLDKEKIQSSWLHIYVKNSVTPNAKSAAKLLQNFNAHHKGDQIHVALDSFLSIKSVAGAIKDYLNIKRISRLSTYTVSKSFVKDSQLMESLLWPLFKNDWERSFFGIDAISNLLMLNLFEEAFLDLPKQQKGVYLQENQGWEFGMIHAWQANGHGQLTGFPHSTVRFWDLRHFFDPRSYSRKRTALPMPDFVAVSGDTVKDAYIKGGYPVEDLIEVEALRYHYLSEFGDNLIRSRLSSPKPLKLLVLGDYVSSNTAMQMNYLKGIVEELSNIELTIKPHPACPIAADDYPELQFKLSNQPLPELLGLCDVAYTSAITSAAVDAYSVGLRVISVLDPASLNLSPLRGIAGVRFVSSAEELGEALLEATLQSDEGGKRVNYFNVDSLLPRWQALLLSKTK